MLGRKKTRKRTVKYDFWGRGWKVRNGNGKKELVRDYAKLPRWAQRELIIRKNNGEGYPYSWANITSTGVTATEIGSLGYIGFFAQQYLAPLGIALGVTLAVDSIMGHSTVECARKYGEVPTGPLPPPDEDTEAEETGYIALRSSEERETEWKEEFVRPKDPASYFKYGFSIERVDSRGAGSRQKMHSG